MDPNPSNPAKCSRAGLREVGSSLPDLVFLQGDELCASSPGTQAAYVRIRALSHTLYPPTSNCVVI